MTNQLEQSENCIKLFAHTPSFFTIARTIPQAEERQHTHNYIQLYYISSGSVSYTLQGCHFTAQAGDVVIIPPFCNHTVDSINFDESRPIICNFSYTFPNEFPDDQDKETIFNLTYIRPILVYARETGHIMSLSADTQNQLETLLDKLFKLSNACLEFFYTCIRSTLIQALYLIIQECNQNSSKIDSAPFCDYRSSITTALDYIDLHYTENITLEEISRISLMSVRSFSNIFKQIIGKTFSEYVNYLKICHACTLLNTEWLSLTQISMECGFSDITYFGRVFKKLTGISPAAYRKLYCTPKNT